MDGRFYRLLRMWGGKHITMDETFPSLKYDYSGRNGDEQAEDPLEGARRMVRSAGLPFAGMFD